MRRLFSFVQTVREGQPPTVAPDFATDEFLPLRGAADLSVFAGALDDGCLDGFTVTCFEGLPAVSLADVPFACFAGVPFACFAAVPFPFPFPFPFPRAGTVPATRLGGVPAARFTLTAEGA